MSLNADTGTSLEAKVIATFGADGPLARAAPGFMPRAGQTEMAMAVSRTIVRGGALVVEAGTGVGKTFAYLVPALLSGERVLLSTATKTLQDQLFGRDLPRLLDALGVPVRAALLKGRASYLCLHRLEMARQAPAEPATQRALAAVEVWALGTRTGDLAELPSLDERSPALPLVTSTRENCLGSPCPQFRACHVHAARREAMGADVVVVNHHLFFADLAVRESGVAELLPTVRVVVFDEAHQLNETGVQFLGLQTGTLPVLDFARDLRAAGLLHARGLADWDACATAVEHAVRTLRLVVGGAAPGTRLAWTDAVPDGVDGPAWTAALAGLTSALEVAAQQLDRLGETAPDLGRLHERAVELARRSHHFAAIAAPGAVRWLDLGPQLRMVESPLDIADTVRERLLGEDAASADGRAWIFTSATLGTDERLRWFTEPCGLSQAEVMRVDSPFDYAAQAALYVPLDMPKPADPGHSAAVAALAADAACRLGGRTLVLTTTLRALQSIGQWLTERLGGMEVLVQGRSPKRRMLERFQQQLEPGGRACVLVASASFWEGVDVPGDALQLVVIDKLPFPPPNDPVVQARAQRIEQQGGQAFKDYFLPETAVALKQGAGRLIRRESDRGVLVVCDTRLVQMGYGRRLRASLPPMRVLRDAAQFEEALDLLADPEKATRPSTTESPGS